MAMKTKTDEMTSGKHEDVTEEGHPSKDFDGVKCSQEQTKSKGKGDVDFPGVTEGGDWMAEEVLDEFGW